MIKLSEVISTIIEKNTFLHFGMANRLFNLSQLATFIRPLIVAQSQKEVTTSSILMNLSRMQRSMKKITSHYDQFQIKKLTINANLCSLTFDRTTETLKAFNKILLQLSRKNRYFTVNHGTTEITFLIEETSLPLIESCPELKLKDKTKNLGSIGVHFDADYANAPGFLHHIIQQISLQHINIVEISSTYTELTIYLNQKDIRLAFDTLQELFETKH